MSTLEHMSSEDRKNRPMARGLLDYFPDALAEVSYVSMVGNEKHNPGQPLHWSKGKSDDHADCIIRHLADRGKIDIILINGKEYKVRHSAYLAWRALALLQIEIENEIQMTRAKQEDKWASEVLSKEIQGTFIQPLGTLSIL